MNIEDTQSHGRLVLHRFEKVWPQLDNDSQRLLPDIRNIEKFISEINKVSVALVFLVEKRKYSKRMRKLNVYNRIAVGNESC